MDTKRKRLSTAGDDEYNEPVRKTRSMSVAGEANPRATFREPLQTPHHRMSLLAGAAVKFAERLTGIDLDGDIAGCGTDQAMVCAKVWTGVGSKGFVRGTIPPV